MDSKLAPLLGSPMRWSSSITINPSSWIRWHSIKLCTRPKAFSIVATYTLCFRRLFCGGYVPLLPAYSSTINPSSTANGEKARTWPVNSISNCRHFNYLTKCASGICINKIHILYKKYRTLFFPDVTVLRSLLILHSLGGWDLKTRYKHQPCANFCSG